MALRTRIAITFLLLLTAVLAAALGAVSATNQRSAEREVTRQLEVGSLVFSRLLETNRRQLTQAAQAVAADYGFREAVAAHDTDTLASALENSGARIGAAIVVLTSLSGEVIAASGANVLPGTLFPSLTARRAAAHTDSSASLLVDNGRIYQLVTVSVRSPLPVAWISMGFQLDAAAAHELADLTGLGVALAINSAGHWQTIVNTLPAGTVRSADVVARRIDLGKLGNAAVAATLSRSLAEARAPFEHLSRVLFLIAAVSVIASAIAAFWLARNITRPLQDLTHVVNRMRAGAYDAPITTVQRRDELGVLADGLQRMQSAVQSRDRSIRRLAYEDSLTGLMNRTAFGDALNETLAAAPDIPIGVAFINLHRFRRINEHLGYSVGDAVLLKVAARIAAVATGQCGVARLSADQFAVFSRLLPNGADLQAWGASLLMALNEPVYVEAQPIDISATLGLAVAASRMDADEVMRCAELALQRARRDKRQLAIYDPALKPKALDQLSLLGELRRAVERDEFRLYFQPKLELSGLRVDGAEVLLRWQHPTRGLLPPADFIPFAEQTGFIRRITRWTLDHAIAQGAAWHRAGRPLRLAVNISADDIADPKLYGRIAGLLTRHQLPPALLTVELTESSFIEDPTRALRMLDEIASLGVNLSIDDFGTGYSSLSHLARMPVHEVKIDRSFIQGLESEAEFATVVRSAIDMGHALGLKVVAEGIETESVARSLRTFGCDIAQGYLYSRPMPEDALQQWMEGRQRVPVIANPATFEVDEAVDTVNLATY